MIVLIILLLHINVPHICSTEEQPSGTMQLIQNIVQSLHFNKCTLFFYSSKESNVSAPYLVDIQHLYTLSPTTTVYSYLSSACISSNDLQIELHSKAEVDRTLAINNTIKYHDGSFRTKKLSSACLFHVVDLQQTSSLLRYPPFLQKMSSHHPSPLVQRGQDYFLFLLTSHTFDLLTANTAVKTGVKHSYTLPPKYLDYLTMRIYHKIFVVLRIPPRSNNSFSSSNFKESQIEIEIKQSCIYCSNSGPPNIDSGLNSNVPFLTLMLLSSKSSGKTSDSESWGKEKKAFMKSTLFPYYTRDLNGYKIRASVPSAVVARVLLRMNEGTGEYETVRGLQLVLLNVLRERMNFTYKVFPSIGGGGTGLRANNGTWYGVVGDVYHERADLGFGVGISESRFRVIDFVAYYEYISLIFILGKQDQIFTWRAIFWPFSRLVWALVLSSMLVTFAFYYVLRYLGQAESEIKQASSDSRVAKQEGKAEKLKATIVNANNDARIYLKKRLSRSPDMKLLTIPKLIMLILFSTLGQSISSLPKMKMSSLRIFTAFWLLFLIVITTAYTSKLFGFLAFPFLERGPQTFEELADAENYGVGLRYIGGAGYNSFKTSNTPSLQKIFRRMDLIKDSLACFVSAMKSKYACIAYELQFEYSVRKNLSDAHGRTSLLMSQGRVFPVSVGLGVQKGTVFASQVNLIISSAFETGLVHKWSDMDMQQLYVQRRIWEKQNNITGLVLAQDDGAVALTVPHFTGAFSLLFFGIGSAVGCFLLETAYHSCNWNYYDTLQILFKRCFVYLCGLRIRQTSVISTKRGGNHFELDK